MTAHNKGNKKTFPCGACLRFWVLCLCSVAAWGLLTMQKTVYASSDEADDIDPGQSLEDELKTERRDIEQLNEQLSLVKGLEQTVHRELNVYKTQNAANSRLLLAPSTEVKDLEKALADQQAFLDEISTRLKELNQRKDDTDQLVMQVEEASVLNEKNIADIKAGGAKGGEAGRLLDQLDALSQAFERKRKVLSELQDIFEKRIDVFQQIYEAGNVLSEQFDQAIRKKKREQFFKRSTIPLSALAWKGIRGEIDRLTAQVAMLFSPDFWLKDAKAIEQFGGFSLVTFLMLLGIVQVLVLQLRRYSLVLEQRPFWRDHPWPLLALGVLRKSLWLLGTTLFVYTYVQVRALHTGVAVIGAGVNILLIWLFYRWPLDFLRLCRERNGVFVSRRTDLHLRILVRVTAVFAVGYVLVQPLLDSPSAILLLWRAFFELGFLIWSLFFWKTFRQELGHGAGQPRWLSGVSPLLIGLGYAIPLVGLVLELSGYGQLALYWYLSWGRTAIVLLWASLSFFLLRGWHSDFSKLPATDDSNLKERAKPVHWLLIRLGWLAWMGMVIISFLLAWGAKQTVLLGLAQVLTHPIQIGGMSLRPVGFLYALILLLFTHAAARLWRQFVRKRILFDSGLEVGVQESITTIMVYLLWGLGILIALNALGLSTTSMAVAFGALSIGLGFGLQNIFNNFVSGLILLFERPVQVGDVIEVNGTWGTITRINVRATQVQTFDNASLIIPNSEFISQQVKNWSFKDLRLRRIITVGVAYGSDLELVRKTLLEIAHSLPRVLKRPKPDVLFDDFGDSALIFRLRLWTTIEHFVEVESEVRFAIDRQFMEREIEIAFPQRDIHIRSVVEKAQLEIKSPETSVKTERETLPREPESKG
jgi:potassium efflux system protein